MKYKIDIQYFACESIVYYSILFPYRVTNVNGMTYRIPEFEGELIEYL